MGSSSSWTYDHYWMEYKWFETGLGRCLFSIQKYLKSKTVQWNHENDSWNQVSKIPRPLTALYPSTWLQQSGHDLWLSAAEGPGCPVSPNLDAGVVAPLSVNWIVAHAAPARPRGRHFGGRGRAQRPSGALHSVCVSPRTSVYIWGTAGVLGWSLTELRLRMIPSKVDVYLEMVIRSSQRRLGQDFRPDKMEKSLFGFEPATQGWVQDCANHLYAYS